MYTCIYVYIIRLISHVSCSNHLSLTYRCGALITHGGQPTYTYSVPIGTLNNNYYTIDIFIILL